MLALAVAAAPQLLVSRPLFQQQPPEQDAARFDCKFRRQLWPGANQAPSSFRPHNVPDACCKAGVEGSAEDEAQEGRSHCPEWQWRHCPE